MTTTDPQDVRFIDSPTNTQRKRFAQCCDGIFISSVASPNVRTYASTSNSSLAEGNDADGEIGPFYDAAENEEDFVDEEPLGTTTPNDQTVQSEPEQL